MFPKKFQWIETALYVVQYDKVWLNNKVALNENGNLFVIIIDAQGELLVFGMKEKFFFLCADVRNGRYLFPK